jgi:hypothetical protein
LVAGCALGRTFGVVLPVMLFCAAFFTAFFAAVGVIFVAEFAKDAGWLFADVAAEDFVVCDLEDEESVFAVPEKECQMSRLNADLDREQNAYPLQSKLNTRSYTMLAR